MVKTIFGDTSNTAIGSLTKKKKKTGVPDVSEQVTMKPVETLPSEVPPANPPKIPKMVSPEVSFPELLATMTPDIQNEYLKSRGFTGVTAVRPEVLQSIRTTQTPTNKPLTEQQEEALKLVGQTNPNQLDPLANQSAFGETGIAVGEGILGGLTAKGVLGALGMRGATTALTAGGVATGGGALAIGGGVLAGLGVTLGHMAIDDRQNIKNANKLYVQSKNNMGAIITAVNRGQMSPSDAVIAFEEAVRDIDFAESHMKELNQGLHHYISGGYDEMVALQTWKQVNVPIARQALINAISKPNPLTLESNYLTAEERNDLIV